MTDCNYLYLVALFSFWLSLIVWTLLLTGALVGYLGTAICKWTWGLICRWTCADESAERRGYVSAVRDMLVYLVCPVVIGCAVYLAYWNCHSEEQPLSGLAEGKSGGDGAKVWGVDMRWIPDRDAPCWMMAREISAGLWREVSDHYTDAPGSLDCCPVSFSNAFAIRKFLRDMERRHPVRGWSWEIPTERQWLAACRSGSVAEMSASERIDQGWLLENSGMRAHAIANRKANRWGLFDMVGNVAEMCRGELGLSLLGGDYNTSSRNQLSTGWCIVDDVDGYLCAYTDGDEMVADVGLRLCLVPNLLVKAYPGSSLLVEQTPLVIAYSNYVLIYGLLFLLLEIAVRKFGKRFRGTRLAWIEQWSVFAEWRVLLSGATWRGKVAFRIVAKYVLGWVIGLVLVSPIALLIPGFPDPKFSIPEAFFVVIVGVALGPLLLTAYAACCMIRSAICDLSGVRKLEIARRFYLMGLLPIAMVFSYMIIRDSARPFWRELTSRDAHAVRVASIHTQL